MNSLVYLCLLVAFCSLSYGTEEVTHAKKQHGSGTAAARAEIRKMLFLEYDEINIPDDVQVKFGVNIITLDVNEDRSTLEADVWFKYSWRDTRLQWDNVTTGVNVMRMGPNEIWKPDITLYNSANHQDMISCWNSQAVVYSNGNIIWVPPCRLTAYFNSTLDEYPMGEQKIAYKFGSWTYDGYILDLQLDDNTAKADDSLYTSHKWEITGNTMTRTEKFYPCCEEPYPDVTLDLKIKKVNKKCEL